MKSIPEDVNTMNGVDTPPNFTAVAPLIAVPTISTGAPTLPDGGVNPTNNGSTTNGVGLVAEPTGVETTIGPSTAPSGTRASRCVDEIGVNVVKTPPKRTASTLLKFAP